MYQVIIIGAGAAGLGAAIYTTRRKLKTLVISVDIGGQTLLTQHIENYPGYLDKSGPKLMQSFEKQAKKFGAEFILGRVIKVEKLNSEFKVILSNKEEYNSKALILAYGKVPRTLGIPGEDKFIGRGISTCATCDAPLFKNKTVAVIGGGNSALDATLLLSNIAKKVYLIHRREEYRGEEILVDRIKQAKNIELILNTIAKEFKGDKFVESMIIENVNTKEKKELKAEGVFIEIGYVTDVSSIEHLVKLNENKEIVVNDSCETSVPGLFAAGDITDVPFKQTIIAAGQGAIAGLAAYSYLQKLEGKAPIRADWI